MKEKEIVLEAMKKANEPINAGKVVELTGLDRKVVDKVFQELKLPNFLQMRKRL